jgi:hypothetical protein
MRDEGEFRPHSLDKLTTRARRPYRRIAARPRRLSLLHALDGSGASDELGVFAKAKHDIDRLGAAYLEDILAAPGRALVTWSRLVDSRLQLGA